jgi:AbrB family looped-hinge helix DNA binding protein
MPIATLTNKGQVTIPKSIRDVLNLNTGDKIEIVINDRREAVIRPVSKKVDELFCKLHKPGRKAVSVESMNEIIKQRLRNKIK